MLSKLVAHAAKATQTVTHRIMHCTRRDRGVLEMQDTLDKYEQKLCIFCQERLDSTRQGCILVECRHRFHFKCLIMWARSCLTLEKVFVCPLCRAHVQRMIDESSSKCIPLKKILKSAHTVPTRPTPSNLPNHSNPPNPPIRRNGLEYRVPEENALLLGAIPVLDSAEEDRRMDEIPEGLTREQSIEMITIYQFIKETAIQDAPVPFLRRWLLRARRPSAA